MKTRFLFLLLLLLATACSPAPTAIPTVPPTFPPPSATPPQPTAPAELTPTSPTSVIATATEPVGIPTGTAVSAPTGVNTLTPLPPVTGIYNPYAVVLVSPNDVLNVRVGAGVVQAIVGTLPATATGVNRTGPATSADGDRWVEIQNAGGGESFSRGWVNANFLTEYVTSSTFCADSRVNDLLNSVKTAMLTSNGELLSSLVSPAHGLDLRLWRYGTVANYTPEETSWVFESEYVVEWGAAPGSGDATPGTFAAQPLPKLQEVFGAANTLHCNDTLDLATFSLEPWPAEYKNINFYTVYKPGTDQFGGLDWRAWIAGVEYVQGAPKLFALIHFQWEP
jgi:hypothetical protein